MEGVCDGVEVRTHDVSGSHVDDRDMDRVSMEAIATQDMGGRQDALDKEQTSPASVVSKPHVVGVPVNEVMSPQIRQFSWGETVGKSMLVPVTVGKHCVFAVVDTAAQVSLISSDVWEELVMEMECIPEVVQQRFHLPTPTSVLQLENVGEHPAVSLRTVIWVFPGSWRDNEQPTEEEDCRVVQTFGAHPRLAGTQVPWEMLQAKIAEPSCHGIGECELDAMATDMDAQKRLFQLHLLEAHKTGKVLILHLREDPKSPQEVF